MRLAPSETLLTWFVDGLNEMLVIAGILDHLIRGELAEMGEGFVRANSESA